MYAVVEVFLIRIAETNVFIRVVWVV